ncbi:hypothetical protein GALL_290500 [mine drainage metagenome]|jgi:hypothetical protein|uniref:Uncharacterized protein n=1 Tax=mine drainage metagenome TaxID=410659 RepID=A0A1J5RHI0_9ZZZZ
MKFKLCAFAVAAFLGCAHPALGADGEVAVRVDLDVEHPLFNRPLVTVSVCLQQPEADGKGCIEVPDVLVDTGSSGVLLRRSALKELDGLKPDHAYPYAHCSRFGASAPFGVVMRAWVGLGERYTVAPIAVGLVGGDGMGPPAGCRPYGDYNPDPDKFTSLLPGINGILGVGPSPRDCSIYPGGLCPTADDKASYYRRVPGEEGPRWVGAQVLPEFELSNPVAALPADFNDGVVLRIDAPDSAALQAGVASGTLFLGVERWRDKLFGERAPRVPLVNASWLRAAIMREPGKLVQACIGLDTGCCEIYAPKAYEPLPAHAGPGPIWQLPMFCVGSVDKREFRYGPFMIDVADGESAAIEVCQLHRLAASFSDDDLFLLGMPFFYGRTIAFGLAEDPRAVSGRDPDGGYLMIAPGPQGT